MTDIELIAKYVGVESFSISWNTLMPVVLKIITEQQSCALIEHPGYANYPAGNDKWGFSMLPDCTTSAESSDVDPLQAVYKTVVTYLRAKS